MQLNDEIGILALGNLLRRDEGIGVHILQALQGQIPEQVEIMDGGTSGLELLGFLESKKRLIILDAVNAGVDPGEVIEWGKDEVPMYTTGKISMHQMSFAEVLYWAHLTGGLPDEIVVIGIQPDSMEWGIDPTKKAAEGIPTAVSKVLSCLERWQEVPPHEGTLRA
ncbi:MAG: HyaD/HybD family hydrogenase maturation endopeptidase [Desulfitobacteriaceae bacterium]|nr:HyaD/HybD family hydrogenase maturation endopeptidase [Desulfitobacteriaceae bacterium]MDI6879072.1 HyaD/HybD family hydrogenase maturation endopeptidase [Desulfitobacteriaceae bacterium]MDI6913887.1 HyaD/HybD family hydrogenase maturation endopeptidase [Desulfitobacteriaceae bacterium]